VTPSDPRGIRNNNPGNIEVGGPVYLGEAQPPDGSYLRFIDPQHGLRAIIICMIAYQHNDGCNNLMDIIYRWAPPSSNPTTAYLASVSDATGILPADQPDFTQASVCDAMMKAITTQENGEQPYSQLTIDRAVAMVIGI